MCAESGKPVRQGDIRSQRTSPGQAVREPAKKGRGLPGSSGKEVWEASSEPPGNTTLHYYTKHQRACVLSSYCPRQAWASAAEGLIMYTAGFMGCAVAVTHNPLGMKTVGYDTQVGRTLF